VYFSPSSTNSTPSSLCLLVLPLHCFPVSISVSTAYFHLAQGKGVTCVFQSSFLLPKDEIFTSEMLLV
jgi:hypothetical protein